MFIIVGMCLYYRLIRAPRQSRIYPEMAWFFQSQAQGTFKAAALALFVAVMSLAQFFGLIP